ncbi:MULTISPECIES: GntR family transcriptional regulator [unclassified Dehalobacter]|uniref:GntR family transcriptional regulator n=1 Tax=unclassified Dehalobacter TaxID=2635733 RepID=UPI00104720E5|nr:MULTISPECIES: GntR family transcriptional regulator [unclassified Dehalobacter]TCX53292.1 GntR family transcriptional regulator [Dehalobacter sp. 14DCB1]TCX54306.1 GntR family transcriptional regulator [Dehalobacter sp. 12DCB1]
MNFDNTAPIYIQIMNLIKKDIILGKMNLGEKLLSSREYAQNLKVNPNTMVRVFNELEREGVTFTKRGVGTFITESEEKVEIMKKEMAEDIVRNFIEGMIELGFNFNDMIELIKSRLDKEAVQ